MSDYKKRMKVEIDELEDKMSKLADFIESDNFNDLSDANRDLLVTQQSAMAAYFGILVIRFRMK